MLFGSLVLCVLILCRSFCTLGRDIESVGFGCGFWYSRGCCLVVPQWIPTDTVYWGCWIFVLCQLWSAHRFSLAWHMFCLYVRILYIWQQIFGFRLIANVLVDWFLVFNATFSNISAISWRPVLVVEEAGVPGEYHRPWASNW
jgi:hypothetical protein